MKEVLLSIKENLFLKLYLILFSLINFIYVFFEVSKSRYIENNSLGTTIGEYHFAYLENISRITSFLEVLLISIILIYLIVIFIKKDKLGIKNFLLINWSILLVLFFINYIAAFVFSAPSGNINQQLIIPFIITFLLSIYFTIISFYRKTIKV